MIEQPQLGFVPPVGIEVVGHGPPITTPPYDLLERTVHCELSINAVIGRDGKIAKKFWKTRNVKRLTEDGEIPTTMVESVRDRYRELYGIDEEIPLTHMDLPPDELPQTRAGMKDLLDRVSRWLN